MGLPCIVSDISGCNEIITHHMNGILVPRKNTLKLQEAMQMMLERPQLVESLQKNARKIVVELFNKEIVWAELKKEYEKILKENKN